MNYVIGSGWYCSESKDERKIKYGDDIIRSAQFANLWYESIVDNTKPEKIFIVDSNSPIKNPLKKDNIEHCKLTINAGHATNLFGDKYCGWSRSVLLSLMYARFCDADYFVYIEQDVLINGSGIIEHIIEKSNGADYIFDISKDFPQPLQQSFFIIKNTKFDEFINRFMAIQYSDSQISCEMKFAICTSKLYSFIPKFLFFKPKKKSYLKRIISRIQVLASRKVACFSTMAINGGRDRPINFENEYIYFQHGSELELEKFIETTKK
ncbi:hypothetical protein [Vibrio chagasii]|uniref:hypothetical protein n=1 Tax=Vibrio chagasii TaxID=170679 RepID=UPI003734E745